MIGSDAACQLATSYEAAILSICQGETCRLPDLPTRLAMVEAMLDEGRQHGFSALALGRAAIAAGRSISEDGPPRTPSLVFLHERAIIR